MLIGNHWGRIIIWPTFRDLLQCVILIACNVIIKTAFIFIRIVIQRTVSRCRFLVVFAEAAAAHRRMRIICVLALTDVVVLTWIPVSHYALSISRLKWDHHLWRKRSTCIDVVIVAQFIRVLLVKLRCWRLELAAGLNGLGQGAFLFARIWHVWEPVIWYFHFILLIKTQLNII